MLPVYAGSVMLLIGYFVASQLSTDLTDDTLAAMVDPFGGNAVGRLTQYWTPFQRNTQLIPFTRRAACGTAAVARDRRRRFWASPTCASLSPTLPAKRRGQPQPDRGDDTVRAAAQALPMAASHIFAGRLSA